MDQILIHVVGAVLGALALRFLGLHKKTVVVQAGRVPWAWKAIRTGGKFFFYYGLLVFFSNLAVNGAANLNTRLGVSILTLGLLCWVVGAIVVSVKRG